jgi:preprotein translocase subunit SecF
MTKKIPLAIDAKPFAQAIDKSVKKTMTKNTMTNTTMTLMVEVLAVVLLLLLGVAIFAL